MRYVLRQTIGEFSRDQCMDLAAALTYYAVLSLFPAIVVWVLASLLFGGYVANFGNYERTFGALAGVAVFLLWLWITNLALLFGAEVDAELERGRQLQAGMAAEDDLRLPVRDSSGIDKNEAEEHQAVLRGRVLRRSRGRHG